MLETMLWLVASSGGHSIVCGIVCAVEVCSGLGGERKSLAFHVSDARSRTLICVQGQQFGFGVSLNRAIGSWDTSAATDMSHMFFDAHAFNQPIASWNTSAVTDMSYMFSHATAFNQPIGSWNTSAVTNTCYMFSCAGQFNKPVGS
ncbi:unnamed protein product [Symbiodinium sp. CCMP2456]|nr:unnamed protein product [Symbiodinium sp. CCMP2456]